MGFITAVATQIPYTAPVANAAQLSVSAKLSQIFNVDDFGAVGDGVSDDTQKIANAMAAIGSVNVTGATLWFTPGKSYKCKVNVTGTINASLGQKGIRLSGYGATLVGRSTDAAVINVNNTVVGVDPAPGSSQYANGLCIEGFTIDMAAIPNNAGNYGIAAQRSYNSSLNDVHVINEPALGGGAYFGNNVYTWDISNLNCARVKVHGFNNSDNLTSTLNFHNLVANQVVADNCFSLTFTGGAIQGSLDHFVLSNAQVITVTGVDLEGTGGFVYNFGANCRMITSIGNSVGGYTHTTYSTGYAAQSNLLDRPALSNNALGYYAKSGGSGVITFTTTNPTVVWDFTDTTPGQGNGIFLVSGDDGSNGFTDLVVVGFQTIKVVSSNTMYGAPPARTYSYAANTLKLALAAVSANNIRCLSIEYLQ